MSCLVLPELLAQFVLGALQDFAPSGRQVNRD